MYIDFMQALNKKYNCSDISELTGMALQRYTFASSTNQRGINTIAIFEAYGFSMDGLNILDVGCAYGGFAIEAAKKGANAYGIEIIEQFYDFALLNSKGENYNGNCTFIKTDVTSPDFLLSISNTLFDLIIVNDVFEHIYDTVQLLSNLSKVASEKCVIYFKIPNGKDLRYIIREGHSGYCGISLLPPLQWFTIAGNKQWNIYYRQFEYYEALFNYFGFNIIELLDCPGHLEESGSKQQIQDIYIKAKQEISEKSETFPFEYKKCFELEFLNYEKKLKSDLESMGVKELNWKYYTKFWCGFAQKKSLQLKPLRTTEERNAVSVMDEKYKISFVLTLNKNILTLKVKSEYSNELDYAFDLRNSMNEIIKRDSWTNNPNFEWTLAHKGMYHAAIYIKTKDMEHHDCCIRTNPLYFSG